MITDRYHATIFDLLGRTPVVPIDANTFKTRGLIDLLGYPREVLATDEPIHRVMAHLSWCLENRSRLRDLLASEVPRLADKVASDVGVLDDLA